jgi:putative PEP-CTERM system histidine kinase
MEWPIDQVLKLSFSLMTAAVPLGAWTSYTIGREDNGQISKDRRKLIIGMSVAAAAGILWTYLRPIQIDLESKPDNMSALGSGAYFCAAFLVMGSIFALANLEQTLRYAHEHVRWEIKFILLGLAGIFGAFIYIASKVLLFPPKFGLISLTSMRIFPFVFLISCLLTLLSWKRSSGRWKTKVAPGIVYSSITLIGVGSYLIIAGIIARWAAQWGRRDVPLDAVLFFFLLFILGILLLGTDFRHRIKYWIRRHLLAGNYDYRLYWLEASERIRSTDSPAAIAEALIDIVQKAIGAIDISVWIRKQNPARLKLIKSRGEINFPLEYEALGIIEKLFNAERAIPIDSFETASEEPALSFLAKTRTAVIVPLQSSNRIVGLLTVGSDRSRRSYDWDALEFLSVLAMHAAGELHKTDLLSTLVEAKESEAFHSFATFLLHDLKNFASTLSLIAQNASRYQENPDFQRDAFQSVFETAEKMKRLCNSLRTFSAASGNKKPADLNQIARTVAADFAQEMDGRLTLDLNEMPFVLADSEEIERVLRNLLLNAREAISQQDGRIELRTGEKEGKAEIYIKDNGRGMSAEFIGKELFVPFHTTKSSGLGIGLYQSKKIIEAHQGSIIVESKEGQGTTICLSFPA